MTGAVLVWRKNHQLPLLKSEKFVVLALANGGLIVFAKVLQKALFNEDLQKILDWDGSIALCVGSGFRLYLSEKEIWKLFKP
ncbi:hypothetical protein ACQ4M3_27250 [Leptolyngbya sp. AN03gr2]|uniref:hypothetical protein n=1 Tax=Leptolyngbya sp. AN03gr2 TaxID=3423364 RepID=UPI003D318914